MKNEFDNKLTDKGWKAMRRLLDREMPEQRRRRRFAWWPLALLLLPLGGTGGWWLLRDSKPEKPQPPMGKPEVSAPVAESALGLPDVAPAVVGVLANNKRMRDEEDSASVQPLTRAVVGEDANNSSNGQVYSSDDLKSSDELAGGKIFQKLPTFGALPPLPVSPQFVENEIKNAPKLSTVAPFAASVTKKNPEPKRWSFGLAAGLASEKFSALNGFSAGGAVDWQFARKWGLRSGLHYAQYNLSTSKRPIVALDAFSYAEATDNFVNLGSGSPMTDPLSASVLVPVERLRQLEMPLLAWWQPVHPMRVFGGFSTAYNLSAQASQEGFANNQFYYATTKTAQENLNDLTSKFVPRWQVSWQVGAGVSLGRHFELDVFYKHRFPTNNSNANADSDPLQGSNFGTQWQPRSAGASHYFLLNGIWFF